MVVDKKSCQVVSDLSIVNNKYCYTEQHCLNIKQYELDQTAILLNQLYFLMMNNAQLKFFRYILKEQDRLKSIISSEYSWNWAMC